MRQKYKNQQVIGQNKNKNVISNGGGIYSKPNINSYRLNAKEDKNIKSISKNSIKDNSEQINKIVNNKKFGQNDSNIYSFQDKKDKANIRGIPKYGDALKNRKTENQDKYLVNNYKRDSIKNNNIITKDDNNKAKIEKKGNQEKNNDGILNEIKSFNNDKKNAIKTKSDNNELEKKIKSKVNNNESSNRKHNVEIKNDDNSKQKKNTDNQPKNKVNDNEKKINNPKNTNKKEDKDVNNDISNEFENASIKKYQNEIKHQAKHRRKEDYQNYPNKKEDKKVNNDIPKEIENTNIKNNQTEIKNKSKKDNNLKKDYQNYPNKKEDKEVDKDIPKEIESKNIKNIQAENKNKSIKDNDLKMDSKDNSNKKEGKDVNNDIPKEIESINIKNNQTEIKNKSKKDNDLKMDSKDNSNKKEDKEVDKDIPKEFENINIKNIQTEIKNKSKKDNDLKMDSKNNSNKKEDKEVDKDIPKEIESINIKNIQTEIKNKSKKEDASQINNLFNFKKSKPVKIRNDNNLNPVQKEDNNENINEITKLVPEALKQNRKAKQTRYTSTYNRQIKKTEEINEINSEKSMQELSKPGLIGLKNIGATCYMNATLQCFSNCPRFKNYLLKLYKELESEKDSKYKISFALAEVLKNLWGILYHKYYAPENFKNIISELNPTFRGIAANDPKDLVLFIIQRIHTELNKEDPSRKTNNNDNSYDFWAEYISFMNFYKRNNNSIITEEFHFYTNDMTTCSFCNTTINNVQTNNILFFPLEEVRKFKRYFNNYVSIYDCFEYNERQTSSSFHCNACKNDSIAYSMTKIALSAKTLIINLNRGHGMEFNVNIVFEEYLNIRKYVYMNESPYYYELTGVICHFGTNDDGGHFIAYCKNCDDCNWYKFNDGIITKCSFSEVCQKGMHYVLFYSYIQMED